MAWRESTERAKEAAERRLAAVAQEWRPAPGPTVPGPSVPGDWSVAEPVARRQVAVGGWGRPALRGLAALVAVLVIIAAYGVWQGRPRAVAEAPVQLASGVPVTVAVTAPTPMPTPGPTPTPSSPAAPGEVVVHVVGSVRHPGVVRLPTGSRVEDAVRAAGGVTKRRAEDSVNLARVLVDGEQVVVSEQGRPPGTGGVVASAAGGAGSPVVVDLNTATAEALDGLPGIGPVIAARIVAWRTSNGPFRSIDELGEVSGIGDAILGQVRPLVRV